MTGTELRTHAKNVYSQNGEDGILDLLFELLGLGEGVVCEFGAWDGVHLSNTHNLCLNRPELTAILIESDVSRYKELLSKRAFTRGVSLNRLVSSDPKSEDSLTHILNECEGVMNLQPFHLLSIDVDGWDYQIWDSLDDKDHPTIVVIEVAARYGPTERHISEAIYPNKGWGTSALSMTELGAKKGYDLLLHIGANLIFVDSTKRHLIGPKNELVDVFDYPTHQWAITGMP